MQENSLLLKILLSRERNITDLYLIEKKFKEKFHSSLCSHFRYANEDLYNCGKSVSTFHRDLQI